MAQKMEPFKFTPHAGEVGHSMVIGPTGSGKTVSAELLKL
jgi:type IV secretory pathway VirB4 component